MKYLHIHTLILGLFLYALMPRWAMAQECPLDVYDDQFLEQVRQLVLSNDTPRKDLGNFKNNFGLAKMPFDVLSGVQTGLYNKELTFISTWKDADKVIDINARDIKRWQVDIGIHGKPSALIGDIAGTMGNISDGLMVFSLLVNAMDAYNGGETEKRVLAVESYKATHSVLMAKYASNAMQLSMVGISFLDYVLNKAMKSTLDAYNAYWWDSYKAYLIFNYTPKSWAQLYQTGGKTAVEARLREFWDNALVNAATYNQKKTAVISSDALALATFADPFAARFRLQVLTPVLRRYYKQHAEEAEFAIEQKLGDSCYKLARKMAELKDLKRLILAAREAMNKADKEKGEPPAGEKITSAEAATTVGASAEGAGGVAVNENAKWNTFLDELSEKNQIADDAVEGAKTAPSAANPAPTENMPGDVSSGADALTGTDESVETATNIARQDDDPLGDELWDALVADADANPADPVEAAKTAGFAPEIQADEWDTIDDVDQDIVGQTNQSQINAMRDRMAQQVASDKNRISANSQRQYANVQAQRRRAREEYQRRQAQQRAELAASLQAFANMMNAENQPVAQPPVRSSIPTSRSSTGSTSGGMTNAQYQRLLKSCMDAKYAKARASGFPIMDPNGPRIQCDAQIRNGSSSRSVSSGKRRSVTNRKSRPSQPSRSSSTPSRSSASASNGMEAWRTEKTWTVYIESIGGYERAYATINTCKLLSHTNKCVVLIANCKGQGPVVLPRDKLDWFADKVAKGKLLLVRETGTYNPVCSTNGS